MNLLYAFALSVSTFISVSITVTAWRRRNAPGASGLAMFMLTLAVWSSTYAIRWCFDDQTTQYFWLDATYLGVVAGPFFLTIFALQSTHREHLLTRRNLILLSIEPILTLVLLWTDNFHGLFYNGMRTTGSILNGGPWFWINVIYSYSIYLLMLLFFAWEYGLASHVYRRQIGTILLGMIVSWIGNIISFSKILPFANLDITPFVFILSGFVFAYGLVRYGLLDIVPFAHDRLIQSLPDGVLVLDVKHRIVEINPAARNMSGLSLDEIGKPVSEALAHWPNLKDIHLTAVESQTEIHIVQNTPRDIEVRVMPLFDSHKNLSGTLILLRDITERKQAEEATKQEQIISNAIIDSIPGTFYMLDKNGNYVRWNAYQRDEIIGKPENQIAGMNAADTIHPDDRANIQSKIANVLRNGVDELVEARVLLHGGPAFRWMLLTGRQMISEGKTSLVGIGIDITERKQATLALQKARDELEERVIERTTDLQQVNIELDRANIELKHANRLKDEFLSSMSHELRTPLTGILGLSESLQMKTYGDLNEKQLGALFNIEASGRHLLELINDILDLSKIEAGQLKLELGVHALNSICQSSLQITKGLAQKKHQQVSFVINPADLTIKADARRLKQMLMNLLSNAIKFTPENGQIGLEVKVDEDAHLVKLTVWDKGIGIKPENIKHLFKPFVQLDSSLSRQYSGTGLGLSLVKRMSELHGGNVEVESSFGVGSRFTILLPWVVSEAEMVSTPPSFANKLLPPAPTTESLTPLILIADDNNMVLESLTDILRSQQYRVVATHSGEELLSRAAELQPDLMLVDIQMPEMDGLETIRRLRAHVNKAVAASPVIAVTALAMTGDREICLAAGANDYLSKPVNLPLLFQTIHDLLNKTGKPETK